MGVLAATAAGTILTLLSYVGAVSSSIRTKMDAAERSVTTVALNTMGNESQQESSTVVFLLSQVLTGSPLQLLMNTESGNGYEDWRLLCRREEPQSGTARAAHLTGLLRTQFSGGMKGFEEELEKFEGNVRRYELTYNELLADSVHQALLKSNAPAEIKLQIEFQDYFSANELYTALVGFVRTRDSYAYDAGPSTGPAPMEVGAIMKGKGGKKGGCKGKDKGKIDNKGAKGKGKTKGVGKRRSSMVGAMVVASTGTS